MPKSDMLDFKGVVKELLPGALFQVEVEMGGNPKILLCKLSGKLLMNHIRVAVGDKVDVEVSPYDLNKGRITWRNK